MTVIYCQDDSIWNDFSPKILKRVTDLEQFEDDFLIALFRLYPPDEDVVVGKVQRVER